MLMPAHARRPARGFTVVELLMVLAVIALLATVLPAALQNARATARRAQCQNNLRIIGLALHNYHDTFNTFPPGWVQADAQGDSSGGFGWQTMVLPFLEHQTLFNELWIVEKVKHEGKTVTAKYFPGLPDKPTPPLRKTIPVFRCPSDPTEALNPLRNSFATSNYSGNFGHAAEPRWAPAPLAQFWPGAVEGEVVSNGIFWRNSMCRFAQLTDGSVTIFLAGERSVKSAAGIWPGVTSNRNRSDQVTDCRAGNEINSGIDAFSSLHGRGSNFLMCDGSVRFVKETIDSGLKDGKPGVYQLLAGRNDGIPLPKDF